MLRDVQGIVSGVPLEGGTPEERVAAAGIGMTILREHSRVAKSEIRAAKAAAKKEAKQNTEPTLAARCRKRCRSQEAKIDEANKSINR